MRMRLRTRATVRITLARAAYRVALCMGRGRIVAAALAASMLLFGHTFKYRINPNAKEHRRGDMQ
jgi:hypothetical protein